MGNLIAQTAKTAVKKVHGNFSTTCISQAQVQALSSATVGRGTLKTITVAVAHQLLEVDATEWLCCVSQEECCKRSRTRVDAQTFIQGKHCVENEGQQLRRRAL